jgi:outer membrane translocation and assembly module TamA
MVNLNSELRFSLPFRLGLVLFLDSGNVWERFQEVDLTHLKSSIGSGIRYNTPVGPLRLDYGYKLHPHGGESLYEIHFTLGQAF